MLERHGESSKIGENDDGGKKEMKGLFSLNFTTRRDLP